MEKSAPRLTKILTEAAINSRGWDGPPSPIQQTYPRLKAKDRCADVDLGLSYLKVSIQAEVRIFVNLGIFYSKFS